MATSSSLSSENEVTDHPFQFLDKPGPRAAYEARQANGGFYLRIDMPGVPPDGVKLVKRGEARTVTFTGKAPKHCKSDASGRVYGGYVVLDRNPDEVDVEMTVVNGSLKLFFPDTEGLLHFLPAKTPPPLVQRCPGQVKHIGDEKECCFNKFIQCLAQTVIPGLENITLHPKDCSCCIDEHKNNQEPLVPVIDMTPRYDINPYLLDGVRGVYETILIVNAAGEHKYIRVDMPGLGEENNWFRIEKGKALFYGGEGTKEHHLDEGGRSYGGGLMLQCDCCKMIDVKHELKHGVLRISLRKHTKLGSSGRNCKVAVLQRSA